MMVSELFAKWIEYFGAGGFVMPPLAIGTIVLWYGLGWRLATLQRGSRKTVYQLVEGGMKLEPTGIVDEAVKVGLSLRDRYQGKNLRPQLDEEFYAIERTMSRFSTVVRSIVIVAPLAGLLGTVGGMIETFDALGDSALFSQTGGIAGGISQALISTQMGLAVAVPGVIVGRILEKRQATLTDELDRIKDILCSKSGGEA